MRWCVMDFGGRAFGQLWHRPRIRLGGRCEPEQGGAGNRRQPKLSRIDRSRWRGRFLASRSECHGDRRERRGGDPAYGGYRAIRSALQCGREGVEAVVVVVEPFPPHARPQITLRTPGQESQFIGTIISTGAGIRLPGAATSLVTGPWRTPPDLEIKVAAGGAAPNVSKNKTLRDRAFREISYRKT
jgi:hypothetical protein